MQETVLTDGSWANPGLQNQVAMETATAVADLAKLVKDSGEVAFSGIAGVGDAIVGLPELAHNCLEVTKLTGKCVGRIGIESAMLIDAAEREDVTSFERHAQTMQHTCAQVSQGINDYLTQLKECRHQYDGHITKEDLKGLARAGGRFVAEGVILSNVLKGSTKILKGVAHYAQSAESACAQLQYIKDVSGAQVRNVLLNAQLNLASPMQKMPAARNAVEQVVTHALAPEVTRIPSVAQAVKESIAKAIVQQSEGSLSSSFAQKIGQFLSCEPKPGFITLPGSTQNRQLKDNSSVKAGKNTCEIEAKRESIRQIIMNRERKITNEEAHILGFRGEKVEDVKSYNKMTGKITIHTESVGGAEKGQRVLSELVSEKLEIAKLLQKQIEPLENCGERTRYVFDDGSSFQSRSLGKSGHFKIDICDTVNNIKEKITFK